MQDVVVHVTEVSSASKTALSSIFHDAFHDALANRGQMDAAVYEVSGFCGRKFRLFLNNLVRAIGEDARYLEVGIFKGATLCAALSGNTVKATAIDNWTWVRENSVAKEFYKNLSEFKTYNTAVTILESDFRKISGDLLGSNNIYFYDGNHEERDQYDGIMWALPALEQTSIILVDDWNWPGVRSGTMNAIRDAHLHIDTMVELRTSFDDKLPKHAYGGSEWHNGFFGAVVSK